MQLFTDSNKRRWVLALIGGVVCAGLYKLYLYTNDREQFEDSNMLVSLLLIAIPTAVIYVVLKFVSAAKSK